MLLQLLSLFLYVSNVFMMSIQIYENKGEQKNPPKAQQNNTHESTQEEKYMYNSYDSNPSFNVWLFELYLFNCIGTAVFFRLFIHLSRTRSVTGQVQRSLYGIFSKVQQLCCLFIHFLQISLEKLLLFLMFRVLKKRRLKKYYLLKPRIIILFCF